MKIMIQTPHNSASHLDIFFSLKQLVAQQLSQGNPKDVVQFHWRCSKSKQILKFIKTLFY